MHPRLPTSAPVPAPAGDLLESWKEIARYLNRDIRRIQRWERSKGLPVHRLPGGEKPAGELVSIETAPHLMCRRR